MLFYCYLKPELGEIFHLRRNVNKVDRDILAGDVVLVAVGGKARGEFFLVKENSETFQVYISLAYLGLYLADKPFGNALGQVGLFYGVTEDNPIF